MKLSSYKFSNSSNLSIQGFCKFKKFWRFNDNYDWPGKAKIIGFTLLLLLVSMPTYANDFYPANVMPLNGAEYRPNDMIPISFDVCLGYDYPAAAGEWYVEITILDEESHILHFETIQGFDANGPQCYPISNAQAFIPPWVGTFTLRIQTFYAQEINAENDLYQSIFIVKELKDLALLAVPYPLPNAELFAGLWVKFGFLIDNIGDIPFNANDWYINVYADPFTPIAIANGVDIAAGEEVCLISNDFPITNSDIPSTNFTFTINSPTDENNENNIKMVEYTNVGQRPLWLNEFGNSFTLSKILNLSANNEFIEVVTNLSIQNSQLYKVTIYDSTGHQIQTSTLDQFTSGETVDSFTVSSFDFIGDILPNNYGGIALSYDSLKISDSFISWGGAITAVDGDWKDSTSTDIGIVPQPGSSIALAGNGTDFEQYSWELTSTPSPGAFNPNQEVPVELISFTASVSGKDVILKWITATEKNNSGFQVERTVETGNKFFNFENIGFVKGAGTTTETNEYSFIDGTVPDTKLKYRLKQIDYDGSFSYSDVIEVNFVDALNFNLSQNYPNPFNPSTTISFSIPASDFITLKVFDVLGNEIKTLFSDYKSAGRYEIDFDAKNLASGIYFYKIQSSKFVQIKKMVLAR